MAFLWPTRISTPHREHVRVDHLIFEFEDPDPASKCGEAQDPTFWTGYEAERRVIIFCFEGVCYIVENRDVCPQCFENLRKNSDFGVDFLRGTVLLAISHNSPLLKIQSLSHRTKLFKSGRCFVHPLTPGSLRLSQLQRVYRIHTAFAITIKIT